LRGKNTKTNALCHQRAKFRNVTAGGAYGSQWPLNCYLGIYSRVP